MEANDSVLDAAPSSVRPILVLIINAVIPLITAAVQAIHSLDQTIAALTAVTGPTRQSQSSTVVDEVFKGSVEDSMVTDTEETCDVNPTKHDYLRGYFLTSLPKRFANLFDAQDNASILAQTNHVLRRHLGEKLQSEMIKYNDMLQHDGVKKLITKQINDSKLLVSFDGQTIETCTRVLTSKGVTSWIIQAGRTQAILAAHKAQTKPNAPKKAVKNPQQTRGPTKTAGKKRNQPSSSNTGKKPSQVRKPPINLIGKIHIPKKVYNLLKLGANYAIEWVQPTPVEAWKQQERLKPETQQTEFPKTKLTNKQSEFLKSHNITFDLYLIVAQLFKWMALTLEIPEEGLWENFWHPDIKRAQINLELFNYLKNPKNANPLRDLTRLLKSRNIVGKMADKNAGLTLMSHDWYDEKLTTHLKTANAYANISNDPSAKIIAELKWICKKFGHKTEAWFDEKNHKIVVPEIYMMPKIHKTPIGVRPIIPSHTWFTTKAAKHIHRVLLPVVQKMGWVIQDRLKLLQELENHSFTSNSLHLATMDVTAMYTSIDLGTGLETVERMLARFAPDLKNPQFILRLLKWVLDNNYFQYKQNWYKQSKGAAMGGNASGVFADIVVAGMELTLLPQVPKDNKPLFYRRYRDDIFIVTKRLRDTKVVARYLNSPGMLEFNIEQFGDSIHFLDLTISKGAKYKATNKLDIGLYVKPTKNPYFTHYSTYKPELTKTAWIKGEGIRILRASHSERHYTKEIKSFRKALLRSGFPRDVIRNRTPHAFADRNWLIEKQNPDDNLWYSMSNTKHAHEAWNFIQNNFKPLLKFHNVTVTAHRGTTTLDVINKANKQTLLNPVLRQTDKRKQQLLAIHHRNLVAAKEISKHDRNNFLVREYIRQRKSLRVQTAQTKSGTLNKSPPSTDATERRNAGPTASRRPKRAPTNSSEGALALAEQLCKKPRATNAVT